jgi:hypothetical protein
LLPVSGSTADAEVFATALTVARTFDSHLIALKSARAAETPWREIRRDG